MTELQIFKYNNIQVRTIDKDGEPWFVGKDVANILKYQNGSRDINRHVDEEDRTDVAIHDGIQNRNMMIINESGLYSLIMSSQLPSAKKFKRWVTSEVLPSIRKHGMYAKDELLDNPDLMIDVLQKLKAEREEKKLLENKNIILQQKVAEYEPKAQYVDKILESTGVLTATQIAADYGLSARQLNKILSDERIQYKVGGQWILYKNHMNLGYTKSTTIHFDRSDGTPDTKLNTCWTQKGRLLIHNILESRGIQANMDRKAVS